MPLCQDQGPLFVPSPTIFCKRPGTPSTAEPWQYRLSNAFGSCCSLLSSPLWETTRRPSWWVCPLGKFNDGEVAGPLAISPSRIILDVAERPLFPPLDQALIQAMACEVVAETKEPLSRQSLADLVRRARATSGKTISRSTVWRMLHESAIKPWQHEHWIFPRDSAFEAKAGPIWIFTQAFGKAGHWAIRITCCRATRRRVFRRAGVVMRKCRRSRVKRDASKPSMNAMERYNIWQRGTCIAAS